MLSFFINIYKKRVKKQISTDEISIICTDLTEKKVSKKFSKKITKKDLLFQYDLIEEQILTIRKESMEKEKEKEKIRTYTNIIRVLFQNNYLTNNEIIHLHDLSKDELIEIIKIYNDLYNLAKNKNYNFKKNFQKFEDLSKIYLTKNIIHKKKLSL